MLAGSIEIQLMADVARLQRDMEDVKRSVGGTMQFVEKSVGVAKAAFSALLGLVSVGAFAGWIKGAIDAADETNKLSQKTGIATKELGGLLLAADQSGLSQEALGGSLSKLAKNMAEAADGGSSASKVFKSMGVDVLDTNGRLRNTQDVLRDVADKFASYEDGASKAALAQALFGKSGADMIPFLNQGADGLRQMQETAEKLGLTIDEKTAKAAEQFNDQLDLLGKGVQGIGTRVAGDLAPTLAGLSQTFLENATSGDTLKKVADGISVALRGLYIGGIGVVEVFKTMGTGIGGVAAAITTAVTGDFSGAKAIIGQMVSDIGSGWSGALKQAEQAWSSTGSAAQTALAKVEGGSTKAQAPIIGLQGATAKLKDEYLDIAKTVEKRAAQMREEELLGRKLTDSEKFAIDVTAKLNDEKTKGTNASKQRALALLNEYVTENKKLEAEREALEVSREAAKQAASDYVATAKELEQIRRRNEEIGLTTEQMQALTLAREDAAISALEQAIKEKSQVAGMEAAVQLMKEELKLLKERRGELQKGFGLERIAEENKKLAEQFQKTSETISQDLTDALMRGFEGGKDWATNFKDTLVNMFKTLVLRPVVQAVVQPVAGGIAGMLGGMGSAMAGDSSGGGGGLGGIMNMVGSVMSMFGGGGGAAAGGGGIGSMLGTVGSLFGAGGFGGALAAGAGWLTGATTFTGALSAAGSLIGTGTLGGAMSGMAMGLGALGPIGIGIALVMSLLKKKKPPAVGTYALGEMGADGSMTKLLQGNGFNYVAEQGGANFSDDYYKLLQGFGTSIGGYAELFGGSTGSFTLGVKNSIGNGGKTGSGALSVFGDKASYTFGSPDGDASKIGEFFETQVPKVILAGLQNSDLPAKFAEYFAALGDIGKMSSEQAQAALETAQNVQVLNAAMGPLGGVFARIGSLSVDATTQLTGFAGGVESFIQKAQSFVDNYYSDTEKVGITAGTIQGMLKSVGIDGSGLDERSDIRALMEAVDEQTAEGRAQLAVLLDVGMQFAGISEYLKENGLTLGQAAAGAPAGSVLEMLTGANQSASEQTAALAGQVDATNGLLAELRDGAAAQAEQTNQKLDGLIGGIGTLNNGVAGLTTAVKAGLIQVVDSVTDSGRAVTDALVWEGS
jgi:hypothetical protein